MFTTSISPTTPWVRLLPPSRCSILAALAQLEADLHEHVHKENNVLFPRAIALEAQAAA